MGKSLAACWKRNNLQTCSEGRWGKPLACDYRSIFPFWLQRPAAVGGTHLQKQAGTPPPPAFSRACGYTGSPQSERHQAPFTPPPHLKPPWNIWRWGWGRHLARSERCKPNLGFPVVRTVQQPPLANIATPESEESWTLTFKPKVHRFKCPSKVSSSLRLTFESECSDKIELL